VTKASFVNYMNQIRFKEKFNFFYKVINWLFLAISLVIIFMLFFVDSSSARATDYDMGANDFNLRFDGPATNGYLGTSIEAIDLDNDGLLDIVIGAPDTSNNGSSSGSIYIIYNSLLQSLLSSSTTTIDFADSDNFSLRIDGAATSHLFGSRVRGADIDNDGKNDLIVTARGANYNSRSGSGSLYVIYNTLLSSFSQKTLDLSSSTNFNLRFDGAAAADYLGSVILEAVDIDNDGRKDILTHAPFADNSFSGSGSVYIIYNTLVDDYSGVGQVVDLNNINNFSLRFDGVLANGYLGLADGLATGDVDGDNKQDLLIASRYAGYNSRSTSGSVWLMYNSLISSYAEKTISLASSTNFNLRFDGAAATDFFGNALSDPIDINGDGFLDLKLSAYAKDGTGGTDAGAVYLIDHSLFSNITGTGNTMDMNITSNFSLRFDGAAKHHLLGVTKTPWIDIDNDGAADLLLAASDAENNLTNGNGKGYLYVLKNSLVQANYAGTGNVIDMSLVSSYSYLIKGANHSDQLTLGELKIADINDDGKNDFLLMASYTDYNSRTNSGSVYLIYNFPHMISPNAGENIVVRGADLVISGNVSSVNSVTPVSVVQYSIDNNNFSGTWNNCSGAAIFSCSISTGSLPDSEHVARFRTHDANASYSASSRYQSYVFNVTNSRGSFLPIEAFNLPSAPQGGFKIITNQITNSRLVGLHFIVGQDIKKMVISLTGNFDDSIIEFFSSQKEVDLCSKFGGFVRQSICKNGQYTIYVKFFTEYGQPSEVISTSVRLVSGDSPDNHSVVSALFIKPLYKGMSSSDVKRLQSLLSDLPEIYPEGLITGYFGFLTEKAIQRFQVQYGITSLSTDPGYGYVGPKTRAKLQEIFNR